MDDTKKAALENDRFSNQKLPTIGEIKAAIPKECFDKNLPVSLGYMFWDFFVTYLLYKFEPYFEMAGLPGLVFWYFIVGMELSSIFCIGHDCGHGTFSNYTWVNDLVGHLTHGMIFAPYWPWQKSHRQHHTYTSHVQKDMGHPWITEKKNEGRNDFDRFAGSSIFTAPFRWVVYTVGGFPDGSHFWPWSGLFKTTTERIQCVVSCTVCVAFAAAAYVYLGTFGAFVKFYVIPVLAHSFWLIMITYLQHQTDDIHVYEDGTWNYVKGNLQTIDRPYGFGIDQMMHHITDGHVAHHFFFTTIPHYHLMEATAAIQKKLEPYGVYRKESSWDFIWKFATISNRLQYLLGEGTGLLTYPVNQAIHNTNNNKRD